MMHNNDKYYAQAPGPYHLPPAGAGLPPPPGHGHGHGPGPYHAEGFPPPPGHVSCFDFEHSHGHDVGYGHGRGPGFWCHGKGHHGKGHHGKGHHGMGHHGMGHHGMGHHGMGGPHGRKGGKGFGKGGAFHHHRFGKGGLCGHKLRSEDEIKLAIELCKVKRQMVHVDVQEHGMTEQATRKLRRLAVREAVLTHRLSRRAKDQLPCRGRGIKGLVLDDLPSDASLVVVDSRFLQRNTTKAIKISERIIAHFALHGIRHVIVAPADSISLVATSSSPSDTGAGTSKPTEPTSVQKANRVGDSIVALVEQEIAAKLGTVVVVSARPCLLRRVVHAGAQIMLPKALEALVRAGSKDGAGAAAADVEAPSALMPVVLAVQSQPQLTTAAADAATKGEASDTELDADVDTDLDKGLLEQVLDLAISGPSADQQEDVTEDENDLDDDIAIAMAIAEDLDDLENEYDMVGEHDDLN